MSKGDACHSRHADDRRPKCQTKLVGLTRRAARTVQQFTGWSPFFKSTPSTYEVKCCTIVDPRLTACLHVFCPLQFAFATYLVRIWKGPFVTGLSLPTSSLNDVLGLTGWVTLHERCILQSVSQIMTRSSSGSLLTTTGPRSATNGKCFAAASPERVLSLRMDLHGFPGRLTLFLHVILYERHEEGIGFHLFQSPARLRWWLLQRLPLSPGLPRRPQTRAASERPLQRHWCSQHDQRRSSPQKIPIGTTCVRLWRTSTTLAPVVGP